MDSQLGLPLKTEANPGGVYRDEELYEMFADIAKCVLFMNTHSSLSYLPHRQISALTLRSWRGVGVA